ncbi:thiosulfate sulfurtransferase (rhodanese)-like domain-containing protein 2 [Linnemannia gamsii]|uniref:Thiosulfate sulfurtransferase (Rhodanese)-like domain-containing protein 2 n=1 Tax=Linnemannia gamsii TaxID=64522 RepID=A0ABQ7K4X4_9FUNG|nr:thiosulfate sulfurtransferase (rhodanese)-like domain-containing protein 2 [Linnemannia gamsii]
MTDPQLKTAKNRAQNELLRQRQTGDGNWSCCDLTCDKAPTMFRHIAATHSDIVQEQTNVQLANMLQLRASTSTNQYHQSHGQSQDEDAEFKSRRAEKYGSDPINLTCQCDPSLGTVILFYAYLPIADPLALARLHKDWFADLELCGKVKLATEGINATLSGLTASVTEYINRLTALSEFKSLSLSRLKTTSPQSIDNLTKKRFDFFKPTEGCRHVFGEEASIKVVEEICPLGAPELSVYHDPKNKQGKLPPKEFHEKLKEAEMRDGYVVLDVRNYYESSIGRFPGAITPPIRKFSSFRDYVDRNKELFAGKTILSYCTGGIRCEKATSYMRQSLGSGKGDDVKVLMLEGGIHNYLEWIKQERTSKETPQQESLWLGKNYIFDARQSLGLDERNDTLGAIDTSDATGSTQLISSCEGCAAPCARYVKCDGFGCHRLIISCTKCSPMDLVATGKSGMCCCKECVEMGEKVREYVVACENGPVEGPRAKRGICQCERSRRIQLGEE